jgi:hypothetical protein
MSQSPFIVSDFQYAIALRHGVEFVHVAAHDVHEQQPLAPVIPQRTFAKLRA